MRVAFFGGSFDPPHRGHMAIAREAIARLALDRVLVAPAAAQPLKRDTHPTGFQDRLAMVQLAVRDNPRLIASTADEPRPGGKLNYTLDTLTAVRGTLSGNDVLFCLMGADAFLSLKQWHRATELLLFCDFIVANRPGFSLDKVSPALPEGIQASGWRTEPGYIRADLTGAEEQKSALYLLPGLHEDVSATEIRAALADGSASKNVLAPEVVEYIHAHGLY